MLETRITEGVGTHSGNGECGFLLLDGEATRTTTNSKWKKKKVVKKIEGELDYEELFPNDWEPGKFKFKVTVEVERL